MVSLLFIFACMHTVGHPIGVVDVVESKTCTIQLKDETVVIITSKICENLKEGDVIQVKRTK